MQINTPIEYSENSKETLRNLKTRIETHGADYWEHAETDAIKKEIKEHYKIAQNLTCAYCQKRLPVKHSSIWDIEHIVARANKPLFMFTPTNLCLACKDCNGYKSNKNVLKNKERKTYPTRKEDFLIIHPHIDPYAQHIGIYLGKVYSPKTDKGKFTIETCNLLRFAYEAVGWEGQMASTPDIIEIASDLLAADSEEKREKLQQELLMKAQVNISNTLLNKSQTS